MIKEFCIALTAQDLLENRAQTKAFLEDPVGTLKQWGKELLQRPPQEAGILALSFMLEFLARRIPVVRVLDELINQGKSGFQRLGLKVMPRQQVQDAATGMKVGWNEPDVRQFRGSGGSSGSGGTSRSTDRGHAAFERHDPLPGSVGTDDTDRLFRRVSTTARGENNLTGFYGIPDDMVIEDGRITIIEEAKMWSRADFNQYASLNPSEMLDRGFRKRMGATSSRTMHIQMIKHHRSVEYLQQNLERFPLARELGITDRNMEIRYVLKVPSHAPREAINSIQIGFEEAGFPIEVRWVQWGRN